MIEVPLEDLHTRLPELVERASAQGEWVAIRHEGQIFAALIAFDDFTRFEAMEKEDMRLYDIAADAETAVVGLIPLVEVKEILKRERAARQQGE
jgi:antitoxin (DNA-binding transcriptional repressor) of toxin-antitoxin stability system